MAGTVFSIQDVIDLDNGRMMLSVLLSNPLLITCNI